MCGGVDCRSMWIVCFEVCCFVACFSGGGVYVIRVVVCCMLCRCFCCVIFWFVLCFGHWLWFFVVFICVILA